MLQEHIRNVAYVLWHTDGGLMATVNSSLQQRVSMLERWVAVLAISCAALAAYVLLFVARTPVRAASPPETLTLRRLALVDENGTERVIIAAPLPDPIVQGKRGKRSGAISGIAILDSNGNERGAYATGDGKNRGAMLTLDSEQGQVFTAFANSDSGATLSLNNEKNDGVVLSTYKQPVMNIRRGREVIYKQPPDAPDLH
jgi:hypothetical protein